MAEKILIVDDDIDSLKLIGLMLQRQGYEIAAANAGMQAITKAVSEGPDLIILDVMMPDMDGYEVCRRLRADTRTKEIPIIMFTAKTLVDDKVAGFEAGADDYLTKPTHPAELASRVKAILARNITKRPATAPAGKLVAFLGTKGGVGTTTLAMNAAIIMAASHPTILADLRLGLGTVGVSLGLNSPQGMGNVLSQTGGNISGSVIENEMLTHSSGLRLLLSSSRPKEAQTTVSPDTALGLVRQLRTMARRVVLDLGAGLTTTNARIIRDVDQLIIVADPNRATLDMARSLLMETEAQGLNRSRINVVLLNRTQANMQVPWQDAEKILGREVFAIISPAPDLFFQAAEANAPIVTFQPNAIVANQLQKLAEEIGSRIEAL